MVVENMWQNSEMIWCEKKSGRPTQQRPRASGVFSENWNGGYLSAKLHRKREGLLLGLKKQNKTISTNECCFVAIHLDICQSSVTRIEQN